MFRNPTFEKYWIFENVEIFIPMHSENIKRDKRKEKNLEQGIGRKKRKSRAIEEMKGRSKKRERHIGLRSLGSTPENYHPRTNRHILP